MVTNMNKLWKLAIKKNCAELVENLEVLRVIPHLYQNNILDDDDEDDILSTSGREAKCEVLLGYILRKDPALDPFRHFIRALQSTNQNHLARSLNSSYNLLEQEGYGNMDIPEEILNDPCICNFESISRLYGHQRVSCNCSFIDKTIKKALKCIQFPFQIFLILLSSFFYETYEHMIKPLKVKKLMGLSILHLLGFTFCYFIYTIIFWLIIPPITQYVYLLLLFLKVSLTSQKTHEKPSKIFVVKRNLVRLRPVFKLINWLIERFLLLLLYLNAFYLGPAINSVPHEVFIYFLIVYITYLSGFFLINVLGTFSITYTHITYYLFPSWNCLLLIINIINLYMIFYDLLPYHIPQLWLPVYIFLQLGYEVDFSFKFITLKNFQDEHDSQMQKSLIMMKRKLMA
ncbi:uncharacterized protein LOC106157562 [Lingula anatina]|uniref:Uncharacterized protein LOC106157562 n=1 Tax=Lingula anatina TaxID=7574 RepID=A0A1S3HT14_LINAN|nr:uncharacterized protein LOC106157562 [Lingula anatina]|eukprot:XP_013388696.1 uncharacterized protein LOC106157562 [Lingula anatina]